MLSVLSASLVLWSLNAGHAVLTWLRNEQRRDTWRPHTLYGWWCCPKTIQSIVSGLSCSSRHVRTVYIQLRTYLRRSCRREFIESSCVAAAGYVTRDEWYVSPTAMPYCMSNCNRLNTEKNYHHRRREWYFIRCVVKCPRRVSLFYLIWMHAYSEDHQPTQTPSKVAINNRRRSTYRGAGLYILL